MFHLDHLPNPIPDEHLVHFLRRHVITLIPLILGYILLLSAPFFAIWYVNMYQPAILDQPVAGPMIVLGGTAFFLYAWLFLFQAFMDYYLDIWVVTNRRILSIEQTGLFSRTVSELRLYRIQDVTSTITGPLHTVFGYGDVEIQTAGEKTRFTFEDIPQPNAIAKSILELSEIDRREHLDDAVEDFGMPDKGIDRKKVTSKSIDRFIKP